MSLINVDTIPLDFECQHCGGKLTETRGRLKRQPDVRCPKCGKITRVTLEGVDKAQRKIDDATSKLERTLKNFGKRR